ncbi:hypothetical protein GCM10009839_16890 [Catenulispora yoronensis]|uniref:Uncharacterized protein n=1 Tax=Catenulispora yoronensis TaxID=450799 RepID=A0ABN2TTF6_9ACTN
MALHMLGKDPNSDNGQSPTIYWDDETDHYVLQGWKLEDSAQLAGLDLPENETVIVFPRRMMPIFPEVKGSGPVD